MDVSNCLERIRHASIFRVTRAFVAREFPTFIEQSYKTRIYFCLSVHYISLKTNGKHESGLQKKDVERECRNIVVTRFSSVSQRKTGSTCWNRSAFKFAVAGLERLSSHPGRKFQTRDSMAIFKKVKSVVETIENEPPPRLPSIRYPIDFQYFCKWLLNFFGFWVTVPCNFRHWKNCSRIFDELCGRGNI